MLTASTVLYSLRTNSLLALGEETWRAVEKGDFADVPVEVLDRLITTECLVPPDEDELEAVLKQNDAAIADDDVLYVVVQPSRDCQLGCWYCGQTHRRGGMDGETIASVCDYLEGVLACEASRYSAVRIAWFGAEPLMAIRQMRAATDALQKICAEQGVSYSAKIVTNGLSLTDWVARTLIDDLAVDHIEITLDGLAPSHDARRARKNGEPTFSKIFNNMVALARMDRAFDLSIRCNTNADNKADAMGLMERLAALDLATRVRFYVAPIHSWGNDAHKHSLELKDFAAFELEVLRRAREFGFRNAGLPGRKKITCMAVRPDARLFDADGSRFTCTEVSYVDGYGTPNIYSVPPDGDLPAPARRLRDLVSLDSDADLPCFQCKILPVCGGSCPKQWDEGLVPCPPLRENIDARIRQFVEPDYMPRC